MEYRTVGKEDGIVRWVAAKGRGIFDEQGRCIRAIGTAIDISARKRAEAEQTLLHHELKHRMKNTLAMVQAIANQTLRGDFDPATARTALSQRIAALSKAQDILTQTSWDGADLAEVVDAALTTIGDTRFELLGGPNVALSPRCTLAMSLGLHELFTNAAKYGALSVPNGKVRISWAVAIENNAEQFKFEWRESEGPPVKPPTRVGFGSRMIDQSIASYFNGETKVEYARTGLIYSIAAPLDNLSKE